MSLYDFKPELEITREDILFLKELRAKKERKPRLREVQREELKQNKYHVLKVIALKGKYPKNEIMESTGWSNSQYGHYMTELYRENSAVIKYNSSLKWPIRIGNPKKQEKLGSVKDE